MKKTKSIIFLGDGMADEPIASLGGKTPLQYAHTPNMDRIAREGRCGTLLTLPAGFPTSSDVANMSVLGCDLPTEFTGRGPLEAMSQKIVLGPTDVALRMNLVTVVDGILKDYSAGHLDQADARVLVAAISDHFQSDEARFYTGVSYRHILVLSGGGHSDKIICEKPDDNQGNPVGEHMPRAKSPEGQKTADLLCKLIREAPALLADHPINKRLAAEGRNLANAVWPWSAGRAGALRTLQARYGITSAVISAVDVINGLGLCLGMDVIPVQGATGYIDTNYEGKADAAIEALKTHDFVYLHVEGIDEVSHEQNLAMKIKAIEDFDRRAIGRVLAAIDDTVCVAVLPDHPVPIAIGKHTREPVPVALKMPGMAPDAVTCYDEFSCRAGALGAMRADGLMEAMFARRS